MSATHGHDGGRPASSTLWSGRFDVEPDRDALAFHSSFPFDRRLFEDDVTGSLAWTEALAGAGVLSAEEARALAAALDDILARGRADAQFVSGADEDVHSFVERQLIERVGDLGKRLHTGRSRNEQVSVDLRLYLRRRIPLLQAALARLAGALADRAADAGAALMPAYTHLRRAQPILVAHFFLAHASALRRDHERFDAAILECDGSPLGSGAVAGTTYPLDAVALARHLGFSKVAANSLDATSDRDFALGFLFACARTMVHLSRLSEDMVLFCSEEFGFFELSDAMSTGSSMMPQKKNPDPLELVRGKTGRAIGHLTGLLATLKGLPSGYNKDLQEDKEAVFDAEDTLSGSLSVVSGVIEQLAIDRPRAQAAASGLLLATDVADYLVSKGVAFRSAHEVVGAMVRALLREGREFSSLTLDEWRTYSPLFCADVVDAVTAQASVEAKRTPQSTSPREVERARTELVAWLASRAPSR